MSRVLKTLARSVVLFATVLSPVAVSAIQITTDLASVPDVLEGELVPQHSQQTAADSQRNAADPKDASFQSKATGSEAPDVPVSEARSVAVAAAEISGNPELQRLVGISATSISPTDLFFSSPGKWHKNSQMPFMSNSPTVSLGSSALSWLDITSSVDILSFLVFAQTSPFASFAEVASLDHFTDLTAGFSQTLAPSGGQSERGYATGGSRAQGVSSGAGGPATNLSSARLVTARGGACGCVGDACDGGSEPASGLISAVARMIKQFASCLISSE